MIALDSPKSYLTHNEYLKKTPATGIAHRGSTLTGLRGNIRKMSISMENSHIEIDDTPEWFRPVREKMIDLLQLPEGWDSYGSEKIKKECFLIAFNTALKIMRENTPTPSVVPTSAGGIQLEWHTRGMDLEIEFSSPNRVQACFEDHRTGQSWEETVRDFTRVRQALIEMASR